MCHAMRPGPDEPIVVGGCHQNASQAKPYSLLRRQVFAYIHGDLIGLECYWLPGDGRLFPLSRGVFECACTLYAYLHFTLMFE